jgi:membrane-bound inhibitor of C-type lysozyme
MPRFRKLLCWLGPTVLAAGAASAQTAKPLQTVHYACDQGKTIVAEYFDGPSSVAANGMPIPGGRVALVLSDGRHLDLPQTMSGSGIRYAEKAETIVFWSKGDTAFVEEGPSQKTTYAGCVARKNGG